MVGAISIEDKMSENMLKWFRHVNWISIDALLRKCDCKMDGHGKMGRGRLEKRL